MEIVNKLVEEKPIVIFSKTTCCMSHSIKSLICGFGANPTVYELDILPNGHLIETTLVQQLGCQPSVPCVFIAQKLIGGENQVMTLHVRNQLIPLLIHAGALWI